MEAHEPTKHEAPRTLSRRVERRYISKGITKYGIQLIAFTIKLYILTINIDKLLHHTLC